MFFVVAREKHNAQWHPVRSLFVICRSRQKLSLVITQTRQTCWSHVIYHHYRPNNDVHFAIIVSFWIEWLSRRLSWYGGVCYVVLGDAWGIHRGEGGEGAFQLWDFFTSVFFINWSAAWWSHSHADIRELVSHIALYSYQAVSFFETFIFIYLFIYFFFFFGGGFLFNTTVHELEGTTTIVGIDTYNTPGNITTCNLRDCVKRIRTCTCSGMWYTKWIISYRGITGLF